MKLAAPAALLVALAAPLLPAWAQSQGTAPASALTYPTTRAVDHVDTYHGTRVADPYRWLEDDNSAETKAWVQAQNAVTGTYFAAMPQRVPTRQLYTTMFNFELYGVPFKEGGRCFWTRNDGLQQQAVLYTAALPTAKPTVALDPNTLSKDGTVALTGTVPSRDGKLLAYGVAKAGSDWQTWRVRDLASGKDLPDTIDWVKFSSASWTPDGQGFFYSHYDEPRPGGFGGRWQDSETFFNYTSLITPADILRLDLKTDADGRGVRQRVHPRRLARGRHQAAKAERLRRLHRPRLRHEGGTASALKKRALARRGPCRPGAADSFYAWVSAPISTRVSLTKR